MKTKKIKLNILIITLLSLLVNPINLSAQTDEFWNNSFAGASDAPFTSAFSESSAFSYQSDMYYTQEMNFAPFSSSYWNGNLLNFNSGVIFSIGGNEGMDTGTGTSNNDHLHHANDVPIGDGLLTLLLVVLVYYLSPRPLHKRGGSRSAATGDSKSTLYGCTSALHGGRLEKPNFHNHMQAKRSLR